MSSLILLPMYLNVCWLPSSAKSLEMRWETYSSRSSINVNSPPFLLLISVGLPSREKKLWKIETQSPASPARWSFIPQSSFNDVLWMNIVSLGRKSIWTKQIKISCLMHLLEWIQESSSRNYLVLVPFKKSKAPFSFKILIGVDLCWLLSIPLSLMKILLGFWKTYK